MSRILQLLVPATLPIVTPAVTKLSVPPYGIAEHDLYAATGLGFRQVYPLLGDVLLAPRDYRYSICTHYFTPSGVRRLIDHFALDVEAVEADAAPPPIPREIHRDARPWWIREGLA